MILECTKYLEAEARNEPDLVQAAAKVVEGDEESLGEGPHADHDDKGDGPQGKHQQVRDIGVGRVAAEYEGGVHGRDDVHGMQQEHKSRHILILRCCQTRGAVA